MTNQSSRSDKRKAPLIRMLLAKNDQEKRVLKTAAFGSPLNGANIERHCQDSTVSSDYPASSKQKINATLLGTL